METKPEEWNDWANKLHHWGVAQIVATLLDAIGPISLLGAQLIYIGQPLLNQFVPEGRSQALANLLENPKMTRAFTAYLRKTDLE